MQHMLPFAEIVKWGQSSTMLVLVQRAAEAVEDAAAAEAREWHFTTSQSHEIDRVLCVLPCCVSPFPLLVLGPCRGVVGMRDVKKVHTTVCRQLPLSFLCPSCVCVCVCMRDVTKCTPPCVDSFLRPSRVKKRGGWTYESEVSSTSIRRISSMCVWWCWASLAADVCGRRSVLDHTRA